MYMLLTQFSYFVIYSFLGWICETVYCSIYDREFVNRGFLNGPFCPIYGVGALLVINIFMKYREDLFALFILSMFLTSVVEYVTSYLLERLFNLQLWDYSTYSFNINGRVCLRNSLLFGVLSILAVKVIHPAVEEFLNKLPEWFLIAFTLTLIVYFISDIIVTVKALLHISFTAGHCQMQLDELAKLRDESIAKNREEKKKAKKLKSNIETPNRFVHRRVINAFPGMKSKKYPDAIKHFKEEIEKLKNKKK